ncbi:MAG: hypothetical protein R6W95_17005 [Desulfosarcina sp.]
MSLTDYHAKYFAHELTRRFPPDSVEKITVAFAGAQVDLNPHQIDAALFAFKSPLSRGALLADEVGLGKTIEAGLVLSQKWAERKRRILVITPSNLRKQSNMEPFIGQSGWLKAWVHTIESPDQVEDHLILAAITDHERPLDKKPAARLLSLPGDLVGAIAKLQTNGALQAVSQRRQASIQKEISERNARFFEAEADKLDGWADDLKIGLESEIKELGRHIKEARRAATAALTLEEKLAGQKQIKALEAQRNQKRRSLFDAQDKVDRQREKLIATIEGKLQHQIRLQLLFTIAWKLARPADKLGGAYTEKYMVS